MWQGTTVFSQVQAALPRRLFAGIVARHRGDRHVHYVDCWSHFSCLLWAQMTDRVSLRDIESGVAAKAKVLSRLGLASGRRSTVARANARRPWLIAAEFCTVLTATLSAQLPSRRLPVKHPLYSIDTTVIELCKTLFPWARHQQGKSGIELHVLWDHRHAVPHLLNMTPARERELATARTATLPAGSILCCDGGYWHFAWFSQLIAAGVNVITRPRCNWAYQIVERRSVERTSGVRLDHIVCLTRSESRRHGPPLLRRIRYVDPATKQEWIVMTTHLDLPAETIVALYRKRWEIELFFKWIKRNLRVLRFWGTSYNAVMWQLYAALCLYILFAYFKAKAAAGLSLFRIHRQLKEHLYEQHKLLDLIALKVKIQT
jgi:hypothetical protein